MEVSEKLNENSSEELESNTNLQLNVDEKERVEKAICAESSLLTDSETPDQTTYVHKVGENLDDSTDSKDMSFLYEPNHRHDELLHCKRELSNSEYDLRAISLRAQVEEKIKEIETKLWSEDDGDAYKSSSSLSEADHNILHEERRVRSCSMYEIKQTAVTRLQSELDKAQKDLVLKDEQVSKLSKLRDEVGAEIEDLTASLFEEANKMVSDANIKREIAQKSAKEANMKFSVLQEEVQALKNMVQSTLFYPSRTPAQKTTCTQDEKKLLQHSAEDQASAYLSQRENYEVDPVFHQEFVSWRQNPIIDKNHPFFRRIYAEDINSCMCFKNKKLADKVLSAIEKEKIVIEMLPSKVRLPKKCALLEAPRFCKYKMNIGDEEDYFISPLSRNRVAAVCELFCYLRYIEKGLIKQSIHEVYLEILKKRRNIVTAKLGLLEETIM